MRSLNQITAGWFKATVTDGFLWGTGAISYAIAIIGVEEVLRSVRVAVGTAEVQIGSAILGVILAGLAILVVFLDEKYIALVEKVGEGLDADLWPFKFTALLAVITVSLGMLLIIIGTPPIGFYRFLFGLSLWSFTYLLWQLFELVRFLAEHAKTRAQQIKEVKK